MLLFFIPTQDVIAAVPPHWRDGVLHEGKGPTYAGAVRMDYIMMSYMSYHLYNLLYIV